MWLADLSSLPPSLFFSFFCSLSWFLSQSQKEENSDVVREFLERSFHPLTNEKSRKRKRGRRKEIEEEEEAHDQHPTIVTVGHSGRGTPEEAGRKLSPTFSLSLPRAKILRLLSFLRETSRGDTSTHERKSIHTRTDVYAYMQTDWHTYLRT